MTRKYQKALIIGRFQPLHPGHVYLIKYALKIASSVVIAIGSARVKNVDNPFSIKERRLSLQRIIKKESLKTFVDKIVDIDDSPDDNVWREELLKKTGEIDVIVGNNDWVNRIFREAGYVVVEIPLLNRDVFQGKIIRQKLREEGKL